MIVVSSVEPHDMRTRFAHVARLRGRRSRSRALLRGDHSAAPPPSSPSPPRALAAIDFAMSCPLVRPGRPRIRFLSVEPRLATHVRFADPSPPPGWIEDLYLQHPGAGCAQAARATSSWFGTVIRGQGDGPRVTRMRCTGSRLGKWGNREPLCAPSCRFLALHARIERRWTFSSAVSRVMVLAQCPRGVRR